MNNLPKEVDCKRAGAALNRLLPVTFDYAHRKRLDRQVFSRYAEFDEFWERCPENWEENARGMLAAGAVFCRPKSAAAFVRSAGSDLGQDELRLARLWRTVPWIYCFFEPIEAYEGNIVRVRPLGKRPAHWPDDRAWDELLIHSPSVTAQAHQGYRLVFAQLCCIGEAFLTYGATIPFTGFEHDDAYFLSDIAFRRHNRGGHSVRVEDALLGVVGRTANICDVVSADPVPFLGLLLFSETPQITTRRGKPGRFASCVELHGTAEDESAWRRSAEDNGESIAEIVRIDDSFGIYLGEGSPMYDPAIFVSFPDRRVFLSAMSLEAYERGRSAASGVIDIPAAPQSRSTMAAYIAAQELFGIDDRLSEVQGSFDDERESFEQEPDDEQPAEPGSTPTIEQAQAIGNRIMHNHNEGIHESDAQIAADLDVDVSIVSRLRGQFEGMLSGMREKDGKSGRSPGAVLSERYGLPPRAIHELMRPALPTVRGALVTREASEMTQRARNINIDPHSLFESAPAYRFAEWILGLAIADSGVPATQAGYVATSIVRSAYEKRIVPTPPDEFVEMSLEDQDSDVRSAVLSEDLKEQFRPRKEVDWPRFHRLRTLLERVGLLRFDGRRFVADDAVPELLDDPASLYRTLLEAMFFKVEWDYNSRLGRIPGLRESAGFLYYVAGVLSKEADEQDWIPMERLGEAYFDAHPQLRDAAEEGLEEDLFGTINTMIHAMFVREFAMPFGLLESRGFTRGGAFFRTTDLYRVVFDNAALKW